MDTAVIFSGGDIRDDFALAFLNSRKIRYLIGADRGIRFFRRHGLVPTHIVGDFDSSGAENLEYFRKNTDVPVYVFQPEKDVTDTQIAVELAVSLDSSEIYIFGGMGCRVDHLLANIRVLALSQKKGIPCYLIDPWNRIRVIDKPIALTREECFGTYVSLFAMGGQVKGLSLSGFKYPLSDYTMSGEDPLGVSNEIVEKRAEIAFETGVLIVAESRDEAFPGESCR